MRKLFLVFSITILSIPPAFADVVTRYIPNAQIVGSGRLTVLFWDAYDATLYAPTKRYDASKPFALKLTYLTEAAGEDIVTISVDEMRAQGGVSETKLSLWLTEMRQIFPNVQEGDSIVGIYLPQTGVTRFYKNNMMIGALEDREFGKHFFDIWLAENTSEPTLRRQLLGLK
ncbi:MAG: chalcone isomerase family protein [Alphaproteobacteria bacterium]|nr:chalcone isomerase family protein [Alphaproteobacteria bacterium]